jgi:predicted N-acetyltransferase YhbS
VALIIRPVTQTDASICGRICFEAFAAIADQHRFPRDFQSPDVSTDLISSMIESPRFFGVVAERDGEVVGSNFLDERSAVVSVGPVTVAPNSQNDGVGRSLVTAVLGRARIRRVPAIRLMHSAYHSRSLSLYSKVGFEVRDSFAVVQGSRPQYAGTATVRLAHMADLRACDALCQRVHGMDRHGEVTDSISAQSARVVLRGGRITAYTTGVGFFGHSVAETVADLQVLIADADEYAGTGFLVPTRNTRLLRWCLEGGLRVVSIMNLMTIGKFHEPAGAYLPSVGY